jgi:hypothetical protein
MYYYLYPIMWPDVNDYHRTATAVNRHGSGSQTKLSGPSRTEASKKVVTPTALTLIK